MTLSKNISSYNDVEAVLSSALEAGGGIYTPPEGPTRWRQRAYFYRQLLGSSRWNTMYLTIDGPAVRINFRPAVGKLVNFSGEETPVQPTSMLEDDPLLAEARALFEATNGD